VIESRRVWCLLSKRFQAQFRAKAPHAFAALPLPLFLVEIATFSLLTLSPEMRISKYSLYFLSAMFLVWTVWAWFGFSYPSDPFPTALNAISKVLSFGTAITLFLPIKASTEKV